MVDIRQAVKRGGIYIPDRYQNNWFISVNMTINGRKLNS